MRATPSRSKTSPNSPNEAFPRQRRRHAAQLPRPPRHRQGRRRTGGYRGCALCSVARAACQRKAIDGRACRGQPSRRREQRVVDRASERADRLEIGENGRKSIDAREYRPADGFQPTRPVWQAGRRIEPPPSVPIAAGTSPAATPAAAPPDEPPGVKRVSQGLRVTPNRSFFV